LRIAYGLGEYFSTINSPFSICSYPTLLRGTSPLAKPYFPSLGIP
jgi:hypothetical protein